MSTESPVVELYSYWRSGCSWRVRIALQLKQISHSIKPINLLKQEHRSAQYQEINPSQSVPALAVHTGQTRLVIGQSLAILEYLEESYPNTLHLLPDDSKSRAQIRQLCSIICCDIQPIANLSVLNKVEELTGREGDKQQWAADVISKGLAAFEGLLVSRSGRYCFGDSLSLADCCLIPQLFAARRWNVDLSHFPNCCRIEKNCELLPAFQAAHADNQIDNPSNHRPA